MAHICIYTEYISDFIIHKGLIGHLPTYIFNRDLTSIRYKGQFFYDVIYVVVLQRNQIK